MEVLVSVQGINAAEKRFGRVGEKLSDIGEIWPEVTAAILATEKRTYGKHVTLVDSTVQKKEAAGRPEPLVWSGRTKMSLTEPAGSDAIREYLPNEMRFGTRTLAAHFLQHGTKNMNKKPILKLTVTTRKVITALILERLLDDK